MPRIFAKRFPVPADAIDVNQHVNNLAYLRWMQDIAIEHSTAQGWSMDRYLATGGTWVVRSHFIEYLRPAYLNDPLLVLTWVAAMEGRVSPRKYLFVHEGARRILARAETHWVYVDLASGHPTAIPAELRGSFEIATDDEAAKEAGVRGH